MDNFNEFLSKSTNIKITNIQPGDTIIFKINCCISLSYKNMIYENLQSIFPNNKVLILGEKTDIEILRQN